MYQQMDKFINYGKLVIPASNLEVAKPNLKQRTHPIRPKTWLKSRKINDSNLGQPELKLTETCLNDLKWSDSNQSDLNLN